MTGETESVQKTIRPMAENAKVLQDQKNMLFSSTSVNYGTAIGVVFYTGMNTAIGRVQAEVQDAATEEEATPLKKSWTPLVNYFRKLLE